VKENKQKEAMMSTRKAMKAEEKEFFIIHSSIVLLLSWLVLHLNRRVGIDLACAFVYSRGSFSVCKNGNFQFYITIRAPGSVSSKKICFCLQRNQIESKKSLSEACAKQLNVIISRAGRFLCLYRIIFTC
jgi:hypothetical protein